MTMATTSAPSAQVLRKKANWRTLHFYQKADTLYQALWRPHCGSDDTGRS